MISYATIPLLPAPPAGLVLPPAQAFDFFKPRWLGDPTLKPNHFDFRRGVKLNTFWNPYGASRFGVAFVLTHQAGLDAIRDASAGSVALPFIMDDQIGSSLITNLFMLPVIPLAAPPLGNDPGQQIYLLVLVDERYRWFERAAAAIDGPPPGTSVDVVEGTTTWSDLYASLATALNITLTTDPISDDYLLPSNGFTRRYQHPVILLDLCAASVGQRIVRKLDGTFHALSASTGQALAAAQADLYVKLAGGAIADAVADVPASVSVAFPRADYDSVNNCIRMNSGIRVEHYHFVPVAGAGHAGTQVLHSSAIANFRGGDAVNADELATLAAKIATDWYAWRLGALEVVYRTVAPWASDGVHDIEWLHGAAIATHVQHSTWEPEFGRLAHAGTFGSADEPPICGTQGVKVVTGELVNGTFDGLLQLRDPETHTDGDGDPTSPIWIYDWAGATSLPAGSCFNGTWRSIEASGTFYVAIAPSMGAGLGDASKWMKLISAPANPLGYVPDIVVTINIADGAQTLVAGSAPGDFAARISVVVLDNDNSITEGTVTIAGTDANGVALSEEIDIADGGTQTYVTTGAFKTIASVTVSDLVGAAAGDTIQAHINAYAPGVLRTDGGNTYLCVTTTPPALPSGSGDWLLVPLTSAGGYSGFETYITGDCVQELRPTYAVGSVGISNTLGFVYGHNQDVLVTPTNRVGQLVSKAVDAFDLLTQNDVNVPSFEEVIIYRTSHAGLSYDVQYPVLLKEKDPSGETFLNACTIGEGRVARAARALPDSVTGASGPGGSSTIATKCVTPWVPMFYGLLYKYAEYDPSEDGNPDEFGYFEGSDATYSNHRQGDAFIWMIDLDNADTIDATIPLFEVFGPRYNVTYQGFSAGGVKYTRNGDVGGTPQSLFEQAYFTPSPLPGSIDGLYTRVVEPTALGVSGAVEGEVFVLTLPIYTFHSGVIDGGTV